MTDLALRVARRFAASSIRKASLLFGSAWDEVGEGVETLNHIPKALQHLEESLRIVKEAKSDFGAFEKDAEKLKKQTVEVMGDFCDILEGLDPKKVGPYAQLTKTLQQELKSIKWTAMLGSSPLDAWVGKVLSELPKKLKAYLAKGKGDPAFEKLAKFYSGTLKALFAEDRALEDAFKKAALSAQENLSDHLQGCSPVTVPYVGERAWSTEQGEFNGTVRAYEEEWNLAKGRARSLHLDPEGKSLDELKAGLDEMQDLLAKAQKLLHKKYFG